VVVKLEEKDCVRENAGCRMDGYRICCLEAAGVWRNAPGTGFEGVAGTMLGTNGADALGLESWGNE
jgi:hypothetical protein